MPPEIHLATDGIGVELLVGLVFLVHAEVKQRGFFEKFAHFRDDVAANPVVNLRRHAPGVIAQPGVVAGGEVQFRYRCQPERPHFREFFPKVRTRPRAIHRQLRVALVFEPFSEIDDDRIDADLREVLHEVVP
ncbi:MAG: hypothetical protein BWY06_03248 [Candidatus Latescibacteria bacterium ADurb.Bin168]|nr:MAG: hypothetical protein BWY06_03248 [Candidatus Latescibacteria bacterium ADurb.Bin168]